jgi:hypothetical protein
MESVILSTPGAISIESMEIGVDENGLATAKWVGTCSSGEHFSGTIDQSRKQSISTADAYAASLLLCYSSTAWELAGIYMQRRFENV